jgi:hypothetical protein
MLQASSIKTSPANILGTGAAAAVLAVRQVEIMLPDSGAGSDLEPVGSRLPAEHSRCKSVSLKSARNTLLLIAAGCMQEPLRMQHLAVALAASCSTHRHLLHMQHFLCNTITTRHQDQKID